MPGEHVDERLYTAIVTGGADDAVMSELFGLEHAHSERAEKLRETLHRGVADAIRRHRMAGW